MSEKIGKILIPISIVAAGLIIGGALYFINQNKEASSEEGLSAQEIAEKAINYINENIVAEGLIASLIDVTEEGSVYKIQLKIGGTEYESYATKDGKIFFPEGYNLEANPPADGETEEPASGDSSVEVPKQDKPDVKLFVMSYCPFGLQAQKMFLPVYDLLKDKAEMGIYFVNYIMYEKKEIDENLKQHCIQKEEKEKFSNYLNCFVVSGDSEKCFSQAGINKAKITNCIFETDRDFNITSLYNNKDTWLSGRYPKFDVHTDLNKKYGVGGSPTVVINDSVIVSDQRNCPQGEIKCSVVPNFTRSPEKFKEVICQSFNSLPEECSQTLSNDVASRGIGGGTGSSSGGSCQ